MGNRNANGSIIEEAKELARKAIGEAYPAALEVESESEAMHEFDAITIDDDGCDVSEVSIMHDHETNVFALVERARPNAALVHEAEKEMRIGDLLQQVELKAMMLTMQCETEDEAAAAWAAVDSSVSQLFRIRLREIGGDVDAAMRKIEHFALTNPQ